MTDLSMDRNQQSVVAALWLAAVLVLSGSTAWARQEGPAGPQSQQVIFVVHYSGDNATSANRPQLLVTYQ